MSSTRYYILALAVLLLGCFFFSACGDNVTETTVTVYLDADGGTALGPRGSRVVVPQGALTALTEFTLMQMNEVIVPDLNGYERRSIALVARPDDRTFDKPLTIQISYDPSDLSIAQQKTRLAIFRSREWMGDWEKLDGSVSVETNEIRALSSRLGVFAVFLIPAEDVENPQDGDVDIDATDCSCEPWIGTLCRVEEDACSDIMQFSFAQASASDCTTTLTVFDETDKAIYSLESVSCGDTIYPVFERPDVGDCTLGFVVSDASLQLTCGNCVNTFRQGSCLGQ